MQDKHRFRPEACHVREHLYTYPDHFDPRQYLKPGREAIKQMVMHKIKHVLGCENKA